MSNSPKERRTLTVEELEKINIAQSKWLPKLIQSYDTTLYEMMCSPLKKALISLIILEVLLIIGLYIYHTIFNDKTVLKIYFIIGTVFVLFIAGTNYLTQYKMNQNLKLVISFNKPNSVLTKYDYESSPVIQSKLMRDSMRGRGIGSNTGSGVFGGLVGYGLGRSSRRRRR